MENTDNLSATHYVNGSSTPEWLRTVADMADAENNVARRPGRIVAEFDCSTHAVEYAKQHGYTVTPGINCLFAVRELI